MVEFLVTVPKSPLYMIFPHLKATLSSTLQTWCVSQSSPAKIWSCWVTAFAFTRPSWRSVTYLSHFSHSLRFLRTTCLLRQTLRNPFSCSPPLPFLGVSFAGNRTAVSPASFSQPLHPTRDVLKCSWIPYALAMARATFLGKSHSTKMVCLQL